MQGVRKLQRRQLLGVQDSIFACRAGASSCGAGCLAFGYFIFAEFCAPRVALSSVKRTLH